ncbi:hypothetical protein HNY73_007668 [Argiope bruennichi]|uniref:Uncharacterized protein n=1 Tax=Argiope bruennichi TaxID=94029 RepID=A0A8T0FFK7_ARGBR|nr:hypothetical protein HNY73_007668 [Argiope bruennichi]
MRRLLSELHLGADKPSQLLRKMRELGGGTGIKEDFLKTLWLQRLPSEMQVILSISSEPLDNLANMADKIAEFRISSTDNRAFAVSRCAESNAMRKASTLDEFTALRSEIAALSKQEQRLSRDRSRGPFHQKNRQRSFSRGRFDDLKPAFIIPPECSSIPPAKPEASSTTKCTKTLPAETSIVVPARQTTRSGRQLLSPFPTQCPKGMQLRGLNLADTCESKAKIELLIGRDVFWGIIDASRVEKLNNMVTCVPTIFEFALQDTQSGSSGSCSANFLVSESDAQMLWDLETLGIKDETEMSVTDRKLLDQFKRNLEFKDGRYEAKLLWRTDPRELENFNLAKRPFDELKKGFNKNEWIDNACRKTIRDQETNRITEECDRDRNEYFMPHRAVVRADKETTKVRVVFNCGSKSGQNLPLNDCLKAAPNLNPSILEVIMKFRRFKVAFHGDIEKVFLMIGMSPEDFGADSVMEAFTLSSDAVTILRSGGFKLRKLRSNNSDFRALWVKNRFCESEEEGVELKAQGLNWNSDKDVKSLEVKGLVDSLGGLDNTKRCVSQTEARILDPVGLIAPFVVRIKCLLQEIWERCMDWDDDLPEDLQLKWITWCNKIMTLKEIVIPRNCLQDCGKGLAEIHVVFCDISLRAYGATSYTSYVDNTGKRRVLFLMSKNRVAPLKTLTLPRLELMAAVMGVRLAKFLEGVYYKIVGKFMFWTDSQIVLYWIRENAKRWKQFVANRVLEVQEKSNPNDWFYCPSADNPADLLTRRVSVENLISSQKWWYGPNWLFQNFKVEVIEELWNRLQSVVAWCLRFVGSSRGNRVLTPYLECLELKESHDRIIHLVQKIAFSIEIFVLEKGNVLSAGKLIQLNPFLDSKGLLRVGGRIGNFSLPASVKHPLILPKQLFFLSCHLHLLEIEAPLLPTDLDILDPNLNPSKIDGGMCRQRKNQENIGSQRFSRNRIYQTVVTKDYCGRAYVPIIIRGGLAKAKPVFQTNDSVLKKSKKRMCILAAI